jgi:hypothetical protein
MIKIWDDETTGELKFWVDAQQAKITLSQVNAEARTVALKHYAPRFKEIQGKPIWFSDERDILCLNNAGTYWWWKGARRGGFKFREDLAYVQNVVVDGWEFSNEGLDLRVGKISDDLRYLGLVRRPHDRSIVEEDGIIPRLQAKLETRKKHGRDLKLKMDDRKDPKFLMDLVCPDVFYIDLDSFAALQEDNTLWWL